MTVSDNTPIIVGVGEASERIDAADYQALSPVALAAADAQVALDDAGISAAAVDVIAAIRQFEVSGANARPPCTRLCKQPTPMAWSPPAAMTLEDVEAILP